MNLPDFAHVDEEGALCVDVRAFLRSVGIPDTPVNRDAACQHMVRIIREMDPGTEIVAVDGGGRQN